MNLKLFWLLIGLTTTLRSQTVYFPPILGNQWETTHPDSLGFCSSEIAVLHDFLDSTQSKAFIFLKDGRIVFEWYLNGFGQDSAWYWASAGKTLTALLVGIAESEQLLNIQDPVSQYLGNGWTSMTLAQETALTIRHLLTMTSGLDFQVPDLNCTTPTCLQYRNPPGTQWYYHNAPYLILANVIEAATGIGFNNYLINKLSIRTGINALFFDIPGQSPHVAFSTARSMARFGLLAAQGGRWGLLKPFADTAFLTEWMQPSTTLNPAYGYLWWLNGGSYYRMPGTTLSFTGSLVPNAPSDLKIAAGLNEQRIYIVPSQGWVIIRMGNPTGWSGTAFSMFDQKLWERINKLPCQSVGLPIDQKSVEISVFPNPASSFLQVLNAPHNVLFEIIDSCGKLLQSGTLQNQSIAIEQLATGTYWLRFPELRQSRLFIKR
jgi:hypothetical protein